MYDFPLSLHTKDNTEVIFVKRFLQKDTSELNQRYLILDDLGRELYTVRGKHTASGEFIRIRDRRDNAVCKIRRLGINAFSAYSVRTDNEAVRINVVLSGGYVAVRFRGISFCIRGDAVAGNYDILDADNSVICVVNKDFVKRTLTLTINTEEREMICIAAAICIDSLSVNISPALQMV